MFIGEFTHTIDSKNRVAIPFKFRRALGKGAIIAKSIDKSLTIYSKDEWQKLAEKLTSLPIFDPKAKALNRFLFSSAVNIEFDHQGRALLNSTLKQYAGLKKEVIIAGIYNKIEIVESLLKKSGIRKRIARDRYLKIFED